MLHSFATVDKASVVVPGMVSAYSGKYDVPYGELKHSYMPMQCVHLINVEIIKGITDQHVEKPNT